MQIQIQIDFNLNSISADNCASSEIFQDSGWDQDGIQDFVNSHNLPPGVNQQISRLGGYHIGILRVKQPWKICHCCGWALGQSYHMVDFEGDLVHCLLACAASYSS